MTYFSKDYPGQASSPEVAPKKPFGMAGVNFIYRLAALPVKALYVD